MSQGTDTAEMCEGKSPVIGKDWLDDATQCQRNQLWSCLNIPESPACQHRRDLDYERFDWSNVRIAPYIKRADLPNSSVDLVSCRVLSGSRRDISSIMDPLMTQEWVIWAWFEKGGG